MGLVFQSISFLDIPRHQRWALSSSLLRSIQSREMNLLSPLLLYDVPVPLVRVTVVPVFSKRSTATMGSVFASQIS